MTKPSDLLVVRDPPPPNDDHQAKDRLPHSLSDFCRARKRANQTLHAVDHILLLREGLATGVGGQGLDRWSESEVAKHTPEISRRIIIHRHVTLLPRPAAVGSNPFSSFT